MDVALFITCLTDTFEPGVGVAVVRVLRHFGCRVHFPSAQTCCGQAHYNNGYHAAAAALGRRMVDIFEPYPYVVTPSGSCAAMVRLHTPGLLADDPCYAARAQALADKTWEFGQFLLNVLHADPKALPRGADGPVTYHYSCHLRHLQTPEEGVRLVSELPGIDFRPLERIDQCCGFGGAFHVLYPDISDAMTGDKLDCIARTGARTVVCNEAGCGMTLGGAARRRGLNVTFRHVAELWAERLGTLDVTPHPPREVCA
ncbi:MAG TPA: (Fe-S)-binding protein [Phycisphaerae bacterium]|nr:(Fe-S)-binding protein [Phycisphaerae bacterium]HNU44545.1 (Fe-S)-binding protein [Phycisphaerae bacterium]